MIDTIFNKISFNSKEKVILQNVSIRFNSIKLYEKEILEQIQLKCVSNISPTS